MAGKQILLAIDHPVTPQLDSVRARAVGASGWRTRTWPAPLPTAPSSAPSPSSIGWGPTARRVAGWRGGGRSPGRGPCSAQGCPQRRDADPAAGGCVLRGVVHLPVPGPRASGLDPRLQRRGRPQPRGLAGAPPPHPDPAVCGGHWPHALPNSHDLISSPKKLYLLF